MYRPQWHDEQACPAATREAHSVTPQAGTASRSAQRLQRPRRGAIYTVRLPASNRLDPPAMDIEQARFNMIEQQIRPWEVLDPAVLELLASMKREDFVPPAYRALAFVDTEVPLPDGQCMLAPKVEARLLQELAVQRHERALEVGAGSGYMAALLAHRARQVTTMEIRPELARFAAENLGRAGMSNVRVIEADASRDDSGDGPFDVIALSGSVAEVPANLLAQLKIGGRLTAIVGQLPVMRAVLVRRSSESAWSTIELFDTVAQRLEGFGEPTRFSF
jgi:protein-L-isoaspartate(D-aspartate) O-methyltransferase